MAYKRLVVNSVAEFNTVVDEATSLAPKVFILFTGSKDPRTGKSWCPDCTRADPVIDKVMSEVGSSAVLVEAPVTREDLRGSGDYKSNAKVALRCVPTLMDWANPKVRLDDSQSQNEDLVRELLVGEG
jgi:thiol-disulfide isomerase/thioredoxin